jgi:hypothetical protein
VQSHPVALAALAGAAAWWLASGLRRGELRTPGPWLALLAFSIFLSPMVLHNVANPGSSLREAGASGQPLAISLDPRELTLRAVGLAGQLGRTAGAGVEAEPGDPSPGLLVAATDSGRPWLTILYAGILLAALARSAWRGPRFPAWLAAATLLALPILNRNYTSFHDQRYIATLLPLAAVALAAWASDLWRRFPARRSRIALATAAALLLLLPLASVQAFYDRERAAGRTNAELLAVAERLAEAARSGPTQVFIDRDLRDVDLGGGGDPARAFAFLLTSSGVRNEIVPRDEVRWYLENDRATGLWILAPPGTDAAYAAQADLHPWEHGDGWQVWERPGTGDSPGSGEADRR